MDFFYFGYFMTKEMHFLFKKWHFSAKNSIFWTRNGHLWPQAQIIKYVKPIKYFFYDKLLLTRFNKETKNHWFPCYCQHHSDRSEFVIPRITQPLKNGDFLFGKLMVRWYKVIRKVTRVIHAKTPGLYQVPNWSYGQETAKIHHF